MTSIYNNEGIVLTPSNKILGIDLGTTNSSVAIYDKGEMHIIQNKGQESIPSVVRFPDRKLGDVQVGNAAKKYIVVKPNEVFSSIKSLMRDDGWKSDPIWREKFTIEGNLISPTDIAAKILSELKKLAQDSEFADGNFEKVVICVPANSTAIYKQNVKDAAAAAGFGITDKETGQVLKDSNGNVGGIYLLEEPNAAAIAYGVNMGFFNPIKNKEQYILVYDLGGGTFDVTILHIIAHENGDLPTFTPISTKGISQLGGDDFDWALASIIATKIKEETGVDILSNPDQLCNKSILKFESEKLKIEFSNGADTVNFMHTLEISEKDQCFDYTITKEEYEKAIQSLIQRTLECVDTTIEAAKLTIEDINRIILVGGSSKATWIREALKKKYNREPYTADNVDTIVARGASYYGPRLTIDDPVVAKLSHHYGVELSDGTFSPLFIKGTDIKEQVKASAIYYNPDDSGRVTVAVWATQENIDIEETEKGKKTDLLVTARTTDNMPIFEWVGEYEIKIPRKLAGQVPIELTLTIDKENCIHAKAVVDGVATETDWKH